MATTLIAGAIAALALAAAVPPVSSAPAPDARLAGQRIVWSFPGSVPPSWLISGIRRGEVGSVLLFASNGTDPAQVAHLVRRLQAVRPEGDPPLLIMSDHEGGPVRRLAGPPARGAADLAALPVSASLAAGRGAGRTLCRAGVNVDLAPVVDLARPGSVIVRQRRSFGRGRDAVGLRAAAFSRGLAEYGVLPAAKHFPGLGAATQTTDDVPVRIGLSAAALRREDQAPYTRLIRAGLPMVMVGTAVYPSLAAAPAALSSRVVRGELRTRLGFGGVVVADALDTPAVASRGGHGVVAVQAAAADVDLLPFVSPAAAREARTGILVSLRAGRLDRADAQASLERVLTLRRALASGTIMRPATVMRTCPSR